MIGAAERAFASQLTEWYAKPRGKPFFVDGGSTGPTHNNNDGLSPLTPKQTLTAALALCTSGADDVVYVLNYGSNGRNAEPSWPVEITKDFVHLLGCLSMTNSKWPTVKPDDDNHALTITGNRVEVANLEIGGGATKAAINAGSVAGVWATYIHDVFFGLTGDTAGQDGIYVAAGSDAPYLTVEDCIFGNSLTQYGIHIAGNATRGFLGYKRGNIFRLVPNIAINVTGAAGLAAIMNNAFALPSDTQGYAITLSATSSGALVDGNRAAYQIAAMSNNPFRDLSSANHWLVNYRQGLTIAPDTV